MIVKVNKSVPAPVAPVITDVTLTLSPEEAKMLRRVCYYNLTVGEKYSDNPVGGEAKGSAVSNFLYGLGTMLKSYGVDRY